MKERENGRKQGGRKLSKKNKGVKKTPPLAVILRRFVRHLHFNPNMTLDIRSRQKKKKGGKSVGEKGGEKRRTRCLFNNTYACY